eukprot:CAMPEP_0184695374 /NCGR_PEP_ID=MMETSP0313-20130426/3019_1 /TAXON_ID=2792 /ORGANISM="Porphyridium aerugineum, Strain SAG 1380-2" /LENGTH=486 /DNA_ID=CAMNT_0027153811 /DNA_START=351 /DNA_END=1808 /DNA_ORIENTATION=-
MSSNSKYSTLSEENNSKSVPLLRPHIVIVGGGFGGLYTALQLDKFKFSRLTQPKITVIDKNPRFAFLPLMYDYISDELKDWHVAPYYSSLLRGPNFEFIQAEVKSVDVNGKTVQIERITSKRNSNKTPSEVPVANIEEMGFDRLVLSSGSSTNMTERLGKSAAAIPLMSFSDAQEIKNRLQKLKRKVIATKQPVHIVVVGGNHSAVETACTAASYFDGNKNAQVSLVYPTEDVLVTARPANQEAGKEALRNLKVQQYPKSKVVNASPDQVTVEGFHGRETLNSDLTIWAAGGTPSTKNLPLTNHSCTITPQGKIVVSDKLHVESHPYVFVLGDVAEVTAPVKAKVKTNFPATGNTASRSSGRSVGAGTTLSPPTVLKATAQVAMQEADCVARNLYASIMQKPLKRFEFFDLGEMLYLGKQNACLSSIGDISLTGIMAHTARRTAYLARMPTTNHQASVAADWGTQSVATPIADLLSPGSKGIKPTW